MNVMLDKVSKVLTVQAGPGLTEESFTVLPYTNGEDIYSEIKKMGKFLETQRTEGISTSDLILNIIRERENFKLYLLRSGFSR